MDGATRAGSGTDGIKDNIEALQEVQVGEGLGPRGSMAKPLGVNRHYRRQFKKCMHSARPVRLSG